MDGDLSSSAQDQDALGVANVVPCPIIHNENMVPLVLKNTSGTTFSLRSQPLLHYRL